MGAVESSKSVHPSIRALVISRVSIRLPNKKRDDIRRQVLQDEVSAERKNADEARRQLSLGERLQPGEKVSDSTYVNRVKKLRTTISEHDQNISAIQREINNLK